MPTITKQDLKKAADFIARLASNDKTLIEEHPIATLTAMRFLMNAAVNGIMPTFVMDFIGEKYPEAGSAMQAALVDILPLMPAMNIILMATLITSLEYAGRKWTNNLQTGNNFKKDAMIGLPFLLFMQTFASTNYGKNSGFGDFFNKLTEYNPLLVAILSFFMVPAIVKSSIALGKESVNRFRLCCAKKEGTADENAALNPAGNTSLQQV